MGEVQSGKKEVGRFMCGCYRLSRKKQMVEEYFGSASDEPDWEARYDIAPTQPVPIIRQNPTQPVRELSMMRWASFRHVMGKGHVRCSQHDQCQVGNGEYRTCLR